MAFEMIGRNCRKHVGYSTIVDMKIRGSTREAYFLLENHHGENEIWVLNPETGLDSGQCGKTGQGEFNAGTSFSFALMNEGYLIGTANAIKVFDNAGNYVRDHADHIPVPLRMCWHGKTLLVVTADSNPNVIKRLHEIGDHLKITEFPNLRDVESRNGVAYLHRSELTLEGTSLSIQRYEGSACSEHMSVSPGGFFVDQSCVFPDGRVLTLEAHCSQPISNRLCVYAVGTKEPQHIEKISSEGKNVQHKVRIDSSGMVYHATLADRDLSLRKMRITDQPG